MYVSIFCTNLPPSIIQIFYEFDIWDCLFYVCKLDSGVFMVYLRSYVVWECVCVCVCVFVLLLVANVNKFVVKI